MPRSRSLSELPTDNSNSNNNNTSNNNNNNNNNNTKRFNRLSRRNNKHHQRTLSSSTSDMHSPRHRTQHDYQNQQYIAEGQIKSGYLEKKCESTRISMIAKWKYRFFVLFSDRLEYYGKRQLFRKKLMKSQQDQQQQQRLCDPKRVLPLDRTLRISFDVKQSDFGVCFFIGNNSKSVIVRAENREQALEWVVAIEKARWLIQTIHIGFFGYSGAGKTALATQLLNNVGKLDSFRSKYRSHIVFTLIRDFRTVITEIRERGIHLRSLEAERALHRVTEQVKSTPKVETAVTQFSPELIRDWKRLYRDAEFRRLLSSDAVRPAISQNFEYFMNRLDELSREKYLPNIHDCCRMHYPDTSTFKFNFHLHSRDFEASITAGNKNGRRRWKEISSNLRVIVYLVSLGDFDSIVINPHVYRHLEHKSNSNFNNNLNNNNNNSNNNNNLNQQQQQQNYHSHQHREESAEMNLLTESLRIFSRYINSSIWSADDLPIFLIFNKTDVLQKKAATRSLKTFFPEYQGEDYDYQGYVKFIVQKYLDCVPASYRSKIYTSVCSAVDSNEATGVLDDVIDTALQPPQFYFDSNNNNSNTNNK